VQALLGFSQVREAFEAVDFAQGDRELSRTHQAAADRAPALSLALDHDLSRPPEVEHESHHSRLRVTRQ